MSGGFVSAHDLQVQICLSIKGPFVKCFAFGTETFIGASQDFSPVMWMFRARTFLYFTCFFVCFVFF